MNKKDEKKIVIEKKKENKEKKDKKQGFVIAADTPIKGTNLVHRVILCEYNYVDDDED